MPATPEQCRRYRQRLKQRAYCAIGLFGKLCWQCGEKKDVELAHCKSTGLCGPSRGMDRRYLDVIRNPDCYTSLCKSCYRKYGREGLAVKTDKVPF